MKKSFLTIAALTLLAVTISSCSNETKENSTTDTTKVVVVDSNVVNSNDTDLTAKSDVPTFSSDEVNQGLAEFNTLKDEYIAALKSKDSQKIQDLSVKYSTWAQGAASWATKLKADEIQKYTDYMTKISSEWTEAAQSAVN